MFNLVSIQKQQAQKGDRNDIGYTAEHDFRSLTR
jgi:hypothetical protein